MFNVITLTKTAGYLGLFGIIFAESGLFFGFFLPGDSLLFTAGFLASQGFLHIWILVIGTFCAAVLGDNVGYAFGKKIGPMIFKKEDSIFFHKDNLERAKLFYESHGKKTIILARFLPGVRTFAPILAGVGGMEYRTFFTFNVMGGFLWGACLPLIGYFLGNAIPGIEHYLSWIILGIVFFSVMPTLIHVLKTPEDRSRIINAIKKILKRNG